MVKKKNVDVVYTELFVNLADDLVNYWSLSRGEAKSILDLERMITEFENKVSGSPYSCQLSPMLRDLGAQNFREFLSNGVRIVYRIEEGNDQITIYADACVSQRQDIERVMVNYCLTYL